MIRPIRFFSLWVISPVTLPAALKAISATVARAVARSSRIARIAFSHSSMSNAPSCASSA
jgi:hypothetical protein